MIVQNIYTVEDNAYCPEGEGDIITNYLTGVFSRIASQVVNVRKPIDWLVVKSNDLDNVIWCSHNFFEDMFEQELRRHNAEISVVRGHSKGLGGATISNKTIEHWIAETIQQRDIQFNYLNSPDLTLSFVGYHLNMPRPSF